MRRFRRVLVVPDFLPKCRSNSTTAHYYSVLGVSRNATKDEIKSAFLSLSKKHHPDLNPVCDSKLASEKFTKIHEAYTVLIDPAKRNCYNQQLYGQASHSHFTSGQASHSHFTSGHKHTVDERFDFYKYDPRVNVYTYARAYNYYDFSEAGRKRKHAVSQPSSRLLLWLVLSMLCGLSLHFYHIEKDYHQKSIEESKKANAGYVRKKNKKSTWRQQQLANLNQQHRHSVSERTKFNGSSKR